MHTVPFAVTIHAFSLWYLTPYTLACFLSTLATQYLQTSSCKYLSCKFWAFLRHCSLMVSFNSSFVAPEVLLVKWGVLCTGMVLGHCAWPCRCWSVHRASCSFRSGCVLRIHGVLFHLGICGLMNPACHYNWPMLFALQLKHKVVPLCLRAILHQQAHKWLQYLR